MRIGACLLLLIFAVGCSSKDKIPSGIIPQDKMEKILWDMIQADQYAALYLVKDSARINVKMETLKLYQQVFQLNKVSRDDFRESFQFYLGRPDLSRTVFDSLLTRANRQRADSYKNPVATASPTPIVPKPPVVSPLTKPAGNLKGIRQTRIPVTAPVKPPAAVPGKTIPGKSGAGRHVPGLAPQGMPGTTPVHQQPAAGAHSG